MGSWDCDLTNQRQAIFCNSWWSKNSVYGDISRELLLAWKLSWFTIMPDLLVENKHSCNFLEWQQWLNYNVTDTLFILIPFQILEFINFLNINYIFYTLYRDILSSIVYQSCFYKTSPMRLKWSYQQIGVFNFSSCFQSNSLFTVGSAELDLSIKLITCIRLGPQYLVILGGLQSNWHNHRLSKLIQHPACPVVLSGFTQTDSCSRQSSRSLTSLYYLIKPDKNEKYPWIHVCNL